MIVSWKWLSEYVDLSGLAPEEVADRLTHAGLEVASVEHVGAELAEIVVAEIEKRERHPNADKLSLCSVTDGVRSYSIVCGADNMKAGDKVALARIGVSLPKTAKFPDGLTMKKVKIRGEWSEGMMCSEQELGLSDASEGILILAPAAPLGHPITEALGLADARLTIELTPNRGDCLSIRGVARETAALFGRQWTRRRAPLVESGPYIGAMASVEVREPALCPRYMARVVVGARVGESPAWMKARLEAVGLRSINNVVDVTNYVMWELGQPLHAFDLERLSGRRIVVRKAEAGETMALLDGSSHPLEEEDLVIADAEKPVALAGVMGGANSEIGEGSREILLECALFHPGRVRRTARRLGVRSESSHRFERGVDPMAVETALDMAAGMIALLSGGDVATGVLDFYPSPISNQTLWLDGGRVRKLLGVAIHDAEIVQTLEALGIHVAEQEPSRWSATPPSWRRDITREADLIEEVIRVLGYDRVPETAPSAELHGGEPLGPVERVERSARARLTLLGLSEALNYSFQAGDLWDRVGEPAESRCRRMIEVRNPLAAHQRYLRTSLLPGLAASLATNQRQGARAARLFELGRVYFEGAGGAHDETPRAALALYGGARDPRWNDKEPRADFYDVKGLVESLLEGLGAGPVRFERDGGDGAALFHPAQRCAVARVSDGRVLGRLGRLHPDLAAYADLAGEAWGAEIDLEPLARRGAEPRRYAEPPRFPAIERDVTVVLDSTVTAETVLAALRAERIGLLRSVEIRDLYAGKPIPEGKKALTLRLTYQDPGRTLTDEKINATHSKLVERLLQSVGGSLSSS